VADVLKRRRFAGLLRVPVLLAATITLATSATTAEASATQASGLPLAHEASAFLKSTLVWNYHASPAGANVRCTPNAAHPYPVVLVEATFSSMYNAFGAISPYLANRGYCVYAFNYGQTIPLSGIYATGNIASDASQLSTEINRVLAETGASKVDLVGWSLGGMMPRYYINELGGASKVNMLVGLAPDNSGTCLSGIVNLIAKLGMLGIATSLLSFACPACVEQIHNSKFLTHMNSSTTTTSV
jgi:triacylglycerol esterase/lipase EstA (alpha/beta hydrolase family)